MMLILENTSIEKKDLMNLIEWAGANTLCKLCVC